MTYSKMLHRPHVTQTSMVGVLITKPICWHLDVWLYRDADEAYWFRVETRKGGRGMPLWQVSYRTRLGEGPRLLLALPDGLEPVTLQDRAIVADKALYAYLNRWHWELIVPLSRRIPSAFKSRSVALHYIRAPSYPPLDGSETNYHKYGTEHA